jgi:hypothetical protein
VIGTTSGEFGALLINVRLPEKVLAEVGVNPTVMEEDAPGATESGKVSPEEVKPLPVRDA